MIRIALPWPDGILSPNSRAHWRKRHKAAKSAKYAAYWAAIEHGAHKAAGDAVKAYVRVTLHNPTGRVARDHDNAISCCKYAQDGIALAIGIDDGKWDVCYAFGPKVPGGAVVFEIEASCDDVY